jgi:hypothetical protein
MYGYGQIKHMEDDVEPFDPHKDEDGAYLATALVAYALGLKTEDVFSAVFSSGRGSRAAVQARHIAIYLTHAGLGMSLARVSRAFGRDRSTVAYACHVVEDRREDVDFDVWCDQLEVGLRSVVGLKASAQSPVKAAETEAA